MRVIQILAASTLALGASACAPHIDYAHRTALDCPDRQGELDRTSISPDRKTCTYRGRDGTDVTLQLTAVSTDVTTTLNAVEASLVGPTAPAPAHAPDKPAGAPTPPAPPKPPSADVDKAAQEAAQDARGSGASDDDWDTGHDRTVVTDGKGHGVVADNRQAHIDLPGLHVDADGDNAKVDVGGVRIDANDNEATVHVIRDVRLRGEAFSRERNGVRATFIARRDNLPNGYRFVGYQAAGPKTGPLTVATVRSHDEIDHGNRLYHDIQRLVRRNGGA